MVVLPGDVAMFQENGERMAKGRSESYDRVFAGRKAGPS